MNRSVTAVFLLLLLILSAGRAANPATDVQGDPLPAGAVARIGSLRYRLACGAGYTAAASPDGKLLAIGTAGGPRDSAIILMDAQTGRILRRLPGHAHVVRAVAFSPDGRLLASGGGDGVMVLHEVDTGRELWRIEGAGSDALVFVAGGKTLAADEDRDGILLVDVASGRRGPFLKGHSGRLHALTATADGKTLASCAEDGSVRIWDVASARERVRMTIQRKYGLGLAFAPDGRSLACGTWHGELYVWDSVTGQERWHLQTPEDALAALAYTPDGSRLLTARAALRVWDPATGKALDQTPADYPDVQRLIVTANGRLAVGVQRDGAVLLWDLATLKAVPLPAGHREAVVDLAFSPDGRMLATADHFNAALWDVATGRPRLVFEAGPEQVSHVAFAPTGRTLAVSGTDEVEIWDVARGKRRKMPTLKMNWTSAPVTFLDGGKLLLTVTPLARLLTVDTATGAPAPHSFKGEISAVTSSLMNSLRFVVASDGRTVATQTRTPDLSPVQLWDAVSGVSGARTEIDGQPLAFAPDGKVLALGAGADLILIDPRTGKEVRRFTCFGKIHCAAFSPDGWELAVGTDSGEVRRYEAATGQLREVHRGHQANVLVLAYAPDEVSPIYLRRRGRRLASGSADQTALIWEVNPPVPAEPLAVSAIAGLWADLASPDGTLAYQAVRRLQADPERAVAALTERLRPVPVADPKEITRLIRSLDDEDFATRERARSALEAFGPVVAKELRQVATDPGASLELRRRANDLLERVSRRQDLPEGQRELRAVETLERIGTPDPRALLARLGNGGDAALLTEAARAARKRLDLP